MIEPNSLIAKLLHHAVGVRNANQSLTGSPEVVDPLEAFLLGRGISHGQDFVDEQYFGIHVDGDGKRQAHDHAARIRAQRFADEFTDAGKSTISSKTSRVRLRVIPIREA